MAKKEVCTLVEEERTRIAGSASRVDGAEVTEYMNRLGRPILDAARTLAGADQAGYKPDKYLDIYDQFEVRVVHDASPNAWTHGDDFACISTTAIMLADHPDEILWVLAHEFGHMNERHMVERVERRYANEAASALAAGLAAASAGYQMSANPYYTQSQYQGDMRNAILLGKMIRNAFVPHRKTDELEADAYAVEIVATAGYPLDRCDAFLKKLLRYHGDGGGQSHPSTSQRIERIQSAVAEKHGYQPTRELDPAEFRRIQKCIKIQTIRRLLAETLVLWTVERSQVAAQQRLTPPQACGPLYADIDRTFEIYRQLVED